MANIVDLLSRLSLMRLDYIGRVNASRLKTIDSILDESKDTSQSSSIKLEDKYYSFQSETFRLILGLIAKHSEDNKAMDNAKVYLMMLAQTTELPGYERQPIDSFVGAAELNSAITIVQECNALDLMDKIIDCKSKLYKL